MPEADRLRDLQVREARHDRLGLASATSTRARCNWASSADRIDLVAQPEPHVGRDLVVARAPVCRRLPASPTSAVRRASMFRWTSRGRAAIRTRRSRSPADLREAALDRARSSAETMPCAASISACARLPAMSARQSRRSNPTLAV
jgi:hypothetical protein